MVSGKQQGPIQGTTPLADQDDILSVEAIDRIKSVVEGGEQIGSHMIEMAAGFYLELKRRSQNSSGRGIKKDLMRLRDDLLRLANTIDNLPLEVSLIAMIGQHFFPQNGLPVEARKPDYISQLLRGFANSLDQFVGALKRPMAGFDQSMPLTLSLLEIGYRHGTGKDATHNSNKDGEHQSRPLSEFGRFVVAFFAEVDPTITEVSLTTHVRNFVKDNIFKDNGS